MSDDKIITDFSKNISINTLLKNWRDTIEKDKSSLFSDWQCEPEFLENRAIALIPRIKFFVEQGLLDGDAHYVWFMNKRDSLGRLFDEIRIANIISDETVAIFHPIFQEGYEIAKRGYRVQLNTDNGNFSQKYYTWRSMKNDFMKNKETREQVQKILNPSIMT